MPTRYSHSADILCLSIRALRLSGEEAPALSGSFQSPGAARWNHVSWSCAQRRAGLRSSDVWPPSPASCTPLPGVSPVFQTHLEEQWLSPCLWLRILCDSYWEKLELESLAHPPEWRCFRGALQHTGRGEDRVGFKLVQVLYYSFSPNLDGSGLAVCVDTHRGPFLIPPVAILWDYVDFDTSNQNAKHFHTRQPISASQLRETSRAHILNPYPLTGKRFYSGVVIMSSIDSLSVVLQDSEKLVTWPWSRN